MTDDPAAMPEAPLPARRYGKRKLPDAREKFVAVRCSAAEYAAMTAAAAQAGLSVGAYLRAVALGQPGPRAVRRVPVEKAALAQVLGALGKIGSNVNQLARMANSTAVLPEIPELRSMDEQLRAMRAAVMKALGHDH